MEEQIKYELVKPKSSEALVEVEQERAIAETQAAMVIAKRFPRDMISAMDRIINACARPGLAEASLYEYSRGGTAITGPSIRLAEAIAQNWGNLQFGVRELEQRNGASTVEAYAWDVETNTKQIKTFQVAHKRHTKQGSYKLEDPRDIYEAVANQGARRLRACILGIIPGDVVEAAVKQCETTLKTKAAVTPERIASLIEKFAEFNVTKEQIEKRIQRHLDAMTPAQLVNLGKIYNSLKDGMSSPAEWFEVEQAPDKADTLKDKLRAATKPEPQPATEVAATTQTEAKAQEKAPEPEPKKRSPKPKAKEPEPQKNEPPPPLVDFETGEVAVQEKTFVEQASEILAELQPDGRMGVLKLYGIKETDFVAQMDAVSKLQPGYHQAFLQRASKQLDFQNSKNGK